MQIRIEEIQRRQKRSHVRIEMTQWDSHGARAVNLCPQFGFDLWNFRVLYHLRSGQRKVTLSIKQAGHLVRRSDWSPTVVVPVRIHDLMDSEIVIGVCLREARHLG